MYERPKGRADTGPHPVRPPRRRWRLIGLAAAALGLLAIPTAAGASRAPLPPPPGFVGTWDPVAATPIDCWIPQARGWVPAPPAAATAADRAVYAAWMATSVRQRRWDGRYEVVAHTDRGSAPFCAEVLPDVWVALEDVPSVQAYLTGLNRGA